VSKPDPVEITWESGTIVVRGLDDP